jgi:hypothetical protein
MKENKVRLISSVYSSSFRPTAIMKDEGGRMRDEELGIFILEIVIQRFLT